jgi:hypothetical protein
MEPRVLQILVFMGWVAGEVGGIRLSHQGYGRSPCKLLILVGEW